MNRKTGGLVGSTSHDNLIAKLYPQPDSFVVELKTPGAYKRGTVLSREADGTYEVLGAGTGKASCVLSDETMAEDTSALAYRTGHFNRLALLVKEGYELSEEDENELRLAGILLSDMAYTAETEEGDVSALSEEHTYTEEELSAMTVEQIKTLAGEKGYTITKTVKAEIIAEFLAHQGE